MNKTPIKNICIDKFGNNIYIKRDDLLPFSFGGNKVRIAEEFFLDMQSKGANCIIGYGNARSNLCRAIANMSSAKGVECHIVSPSDEDGSRIRTSNSCLVDYCGAIFHPCTKHNVAETVREVMDECKAKGLIPYYINGNEYGKGNEIVPVRAYEKVYNEIQSQSGELGINFDYIFLATGTGMTHAGLLVGKNKYMGKEKIIGISVARDKQKEEGVLRDFLNIYATENNIKSIGAEEICVLDEFLCGGYGVYNDLIVDIILEMFKSYGIPFDPTYTGKAFWGMQEYLKKHRIGYKNILFIHTGGTPLFFDFITKINKGES